MPLQRAAKIQIKALPTKHGANKNMNVRKMNGQLEWGGYKHRNCYELLCSLFISPRSMSGRKQIKERFVHKVA